GGGIRTLLLDALDALDAVDAVGLDADSFDAVSFDAVSFDRALHVVVRHARQDRAFCGANFSAIATRLESSIARVIGPTPPGFGETQPAVSQTSSARSPAILPSTRETPTSSSAA